MFQFRFSEILVILFVTFLASAMIFFAVTWEENLDERVLPIWIVLASLSVTLYISSGMRSARNRAEVIDFITDPITEVVSDERILVLYLRSFVLDELMAMGRVDHADRSFVNSLEAHCLFFALGEQNTFGIRMKKTPNDKWYEEFQRYVEIADVVLICPFATKSTSKEFKYLVENSSEKTIVVMPSKRTRVEFVYILTAISDFIRYLSFGYFVVPRETPSDFPKPYPFYIGYAEKVWQYSRERFSQLIQLPAYNSDGRMIAIQGRTGRSNTEKQFNLDHKGVCRAVAFVAPRNKAKTARELRRADTDQQPERGGNALPSDVIVNSGGATIAIEGISIATPTNSSADGASEASGDGGFSDWFGGDGDGGGPA